ncbi:MAG: zinc-ribbon domain-containing protein [Candidatus Lokiarchaeota archaeon]|nr:zinc-ribbon domain-containing protein [Candidatus Lokiarchaeota archaeon]
MNRKTHLNIFIFILSLLIFSFIGLSSLSLQNQVHYKNNQDISISQELANKTVNCQFPDLIWIEAQIEISITSNESGQVNILLNDNYANAYFNIVNETKTLTGNNQTDTFLLKTQPKIQTLPGVYEFTLTIAGLFDYTQTYESILGMGYILMFILIAAFGIPLIVIIFKKRKTSETVEYLTPSEPTSYENAEGLPAGKIKCPKCGSQIPEGLTFCPECGERIPEFLRYNASS